VLFHVSEKSDIAVFEPRPAPSASGGVVGDAVWAIDQDHLAHYLLPRECPRVALRVGPHTTPSDRSQFFAAGEEKVIAVEFDWYARIQGTPLYIYEFAPAGFQMVDRIAGYWISRQAVKPAAKRKITNVVEEIVQRGYRLRLLPNLQALSRDAAASSVQFSIIRMRNAKP
jgi:hypothetical protein